MKEFKISNKGTGRLFSNQHIEKLTRTNFAVPVVFFYITGAACLIWSLYDPAVEMLHGLWLVPLGLVTFSLVEYLTHRFIYHFNATTEKQEEFQYKIHGVHHEFPRDKDRLVMPMIMSIFISSLFFLLFQSMMGVYGRLFFCGFTFGYSTYLLIHYSVHALKPPKNFLKYLWKHHSLHHYASVESAFAVSLPLWDYIFGTLPQEVEERKVASEKLPDALS